MATSAGKASIYWTIRASLQVGNSNFCENDVSTQVAFTKGFNDKQTSYVFKSQCCESKNSDSQTDLGYLWQMAKQAQ